MPAHAEIDIRMKENYEFPYRFKLTRRIPVIVRIDGRSFHTFTKHFIKPFDPVLIKVMQETCKYLCENISGCVLGYVQSDEISLLLVDYKTFDSKPFFDYVLQKVCSVTASMATLAFNKYFNNFDTYMSEIMLNREPIYDDNDVYLDIIKTYNKAVEVGAQFDSRVFNIPKEEVTNYFYSRQLDASRNSIEMLGRAYFSHKQLHKKSTSNIQDMLHEEHGINWNDLPVEQKRGSCCIKETYFIETTDKNGVDVSTPRSRWIIDHDIPIFKGENRNYIDDLVFVVEV